MESPHDLVFICCVQTKYERQVNRHAEGEEGLNEPIKSPHSPALLCRTCAGDTVLIHARFLLGRGVTSLNGGIDLRSRVRDTGYDFPADSGNLGSPANRETERRYDV